MDKKVTVAWNVDKEKHTGNSYEAVINHMMITNKPYMKSVNVPSIRHFMDTIADRAWKYKSIAIPTRSPQLFIDEMCNSNLLVRIR